MSARSKSNFIVGIGASAGGLEAMLALLPCLNPTETTRFVVAQHMAKTGHSEVAIRVLARNCNMPVVQATDNEVINPDIIYVIPSGWNGTIKNGKISLIPITEQQLSAPSVDVLLESIAEDSGSNSIGIILSGTGSDGVKGCRAIKNRGGKVFVQNSESSGFHGMPSAVMRAGLADQQLSPDALADLINSLAPPSHRASLKEKFEPRKISPGVSSIDQLVGPPELMELIEGVSKHSGVKFASYKEDTLLRRIHGRMNTLGISDIKIYSAHAKAHPDEFERLGQLFFVSLSWFFRDAVAFKKLSDLLSTHLLQKAKNEPTRVWVPGCATGEECFSLAVLITDLIGEIGSKTNAEVIGSDLNSSALDIAKRGRYPERAFKEVQLPEIIARHFVLQDEHYCISEQIRALCSYRQEDVITADSPHNLDLVSCRNLLIYMKPELQKELISKFHKALKPGGLLFLGMSENIGFSGNSGFVPIDAKLRIYQRN